MIVLPIVDRELRVAARRAATYRTRLWAALAAILLTAWKCLDFAWRGATATSQGHSLFYTLSGLAFVYCLCIGARVTADCLSEEKRDGTLGLLFLTDLKGWDVVLGKLVASSLNSIYGLLAVLPLLAVPLLLGGVTLAQFGQMVVVLLNALFFSLSMGIFVSALSRNERKAMFGTLLAVFLPILLPFCVVYFTVTVLEVLQDPSEFGQFLPALMANPVYPYVLALPIPVLQFMGIPPWSFWLSIGVVHLLSWLVLLLTALLLPQVWKDRSEARRPVRSVSWLERWRVWAKGNSEQRADLRRRLLERNPFLWLVSRDRLKPAYAWLFMFSMVAVWLWGYSRYRELMFDFYPLVPTVFMVHCFLKIWIITEVSHRLVEDQRNGAMELLLSTPLTIRSILRGQQMALLRQFGLPVLALCALELWTFRSVHPVQHIVPVLLMLVADLFTLMWVAMRLSLTSRNINQVMLKSVLLVLVLPWVIYFVAWPFWQWTWRSFHLGRPRMGFSHRVYFWFAVGMLNNLVLCLVCARPQWFTRSAKADQGPTAPVLQKSALWRLKPQ